MQLAVWSFYLFRCSRVFLLILWTGVGVYVVVHVCNLSTKFLFNLMLSYCTLIFTCMHIFILATVILSVHPSVCLSVMSRYHSKTKSFSEFFVIWATTHISRVNCTEMAGDRPRQPAYEIFSMDCAFHQSKFRPSRFKEACARGCQRGVPL